MKTEIDRLRDTWRQLGRDDPFWAVVSHEKKRGRKWDPEEFFLTGECDIERAASLIAQHTGNRAPFKHVLDFGCGLGRLSRAWSDRAQRVTGVDISAPMIEQARRLHASRSHLQFVLNEKDDLSCFASESFDLVFSLICLQHMPWSLAQGYVREFSRVCRTDGVVAFQLPSRRLKANRMAGWRKTIVNGLPFGLGQKYRKWKHGTAAVFDMYYTPRIEVERVAAGSRLDMLHCEPDASAGQQIEGFFYIFRKRS